MRSLHHFFSNDSLYITGNRSIVMKRGTVPVNTRRTDEKGNNSVRRLQDRNTGRAFGTRAKLQKKKGYLETPEQGRTKGSREEQNGLQASDYQHAEAD